MKNTQLLLKFLPYGCNKKESSIGRPIGEIGKGRRMRFIGAPEASLGQGLRVHYASATAGGFRAFFLDSSGIFLSHPAGQGCRLDVPAMRPPTVG